MKSSDNATFKSRTFGESSRPAGSPDAECAIDGMHKVALEIGDKAKQLRQALDDK